MSRIAAVALSASVALLALAAPAAAAYISGRPGVGLNLSQAWYGSNPFAFEGEKASLEREQAPLNLIDMSFTPTRPSTATATARGQARARASAPAPYFSGFPWDEYGGKGFSFGGDIDIDVFGPGSAYASLGGAGTLTLTNISAETITVNGSISYAIETIVSVGEFQEAAYSRWSVGFENDPRGFYTAGYGESSQYVFGFYCDIERSPCGFYRSGDHYDLNVDMYLVTFAPGESLSYDVIVEGEFSAVQLPAPVPEPATLALLGVGLAGAISFARRAS